MGKFMTMVRTTDGRIMYVMGDALTKSRDLATAWQSEDLALRQAARWVKRFDVTGAWTSAV